MHFPDYNAKFGVKWAPEREGTKRTLQPEQRYPHLRFSSHIIERSPSRELENHPPPTL